MAECEGSSTTSRAGFGHICHPFKPHVSRELKVLERFWHVCILAEPDELAALRCKFMSDKAANGQLSSPGGKDLTCWMGDCQRGKAKGFVPWSTCSSTVWQMEGGNAAGSRSSIDSRMNCTLTELCWTCEPSSLSTSP